MGTRLRRASATTILLLGLLAGLGAATTYADAPPIHRGGGGHQIPRVAKHTPATLPRQNPVREGFRFDRWTDDGQPYDFQTPHPPGHHPESPMGENNGLDAEPGPRARLRLQADHQPARQAGASIRQHPHLDAGQHTQPDSLPAQAADGFHYLQAASGSRRQAAIGSDQHIYTWTSRQSTPTILDASQNTQFTSISLNDDLLLAVDRQGQVHAFQDSQSTNPKPDGNRQYMQAASIGSRIAAISRQGSIYKWSPDAQGQPGKPAILNTTQAPTLESASMDGQPLTPDKKDDFWQTDIPAHTPGQATILITGKQDNQPFTRSLTYTVDQPLTRGAETETGYTIHFDTDGGRPEPGDQSISLPHGRVKRPSPDPLCEGYQFDRWFTGEVAYDFSKPVTDNLTYRQMDQQNPQHLLEDQPRPGQPTRPRNHHHHPTRQHQRHQIQPDQRK